MKKRKIGGFTEHVPQSNADGALVMRRARPIALTALHHDCRR